MMPSSVVELDEDEVAPAEPRRRVADDEDLEVGELHSKTITLRRAAPDLRLGDRLVDLLERIAPGDQLGELQPPGAPVRRSARGCRARARSRPIREPRIALVHRRERRRVVADRRRRSAACRRRRPRPPAASSPAAPPIAAGAPDGDEGEVDAAPAGQRPHRARRRLRARRATPSVAPKARAASSLPGARSTATIRAAPASAAPWMVFSPTPPAPITATLRARAQTRRCSPPPRRR